MSNKPVNFVLVETETPAPLYFPYVEHTNRPEYPRNWSKASWTLRRVCGFRCEVCGSSRGVAVHHKGAPYASGKPGNPKDKHDLRRENLICLCWEHHQQADNDQARKQGGRGHA